MPSRPQTNRRIVLAERPQRHASLSSFRLEAADVPELRPGELLLRTVWLSLDPYMRGRMNAAPSYAAPVEIGGVMTGQTVSQVEESRNAGYRSGDLVLAPNGWQEFAVSDGDGLERIDAGETHPSFALGVLGMTGFTAYVGLLEIGRPQRGETVVVAAATGAVGSMVGQIAKLKGCTVVGIAGGADKCRWAVGELGFDACIDHRSPDFSAQLAAACSAGIDVYFENVGGPIFRTVVPLLNAHARVPVCGLIAHYSDEVPPPEGDWSLTLMRTILVKRITMRGFIIFDEFGEKFRQFQTDMRGWLHEGRIRCREDIVQGLEHAPAAFLGLLDGRNFGKLVVQVSDVRGAAR